MGEVFVLNKKITSFPLIMDKTIIIYLKEKEIDKNILGIFFFVSNCQFFKK